MWWLLGSAATLATIVTIYSYVSAFNRKRKIDSKTAAWLSSLSSSPPSSSSSPWFGRRVLLIVNPIGGTGTGRHLCRTLVRPVLAAYEIELDVLETTRAGHAADYLRSHTTLHTYSLLIVLSGDGLLSEVLNALVARESVDSPTLSTADPASADFHTALSRALHLLPIAILPGGTSNGLVASLFGPKSDIVDVLRQVLKSAPRDVDIMSVQSPAALSSGKADSIATDYTRAVAAAAAGKPRAPIKVDMLTFLYGVVANNDNYVERTFRFLPYLVRTTLAPLAAMLFCRTYGANVRIKPQPFTPEEQKQYHITSPSQLDRWKEDPSWRIMDGEWTSLVVLNVKHPASDVLMAPSALPDDGSIYVSALRGAVPLYRLLWIFLQMEDGSHNALYECEYFKVEEMCVHTNTNEGNMVISGESLPVQSTHIRVQAKAAAFVF